MPVVAPSTGMTSLGTASHEAVPALAGRVLFVAERETQASMTDVAVAATVSLINTGSNQTVATTLTNAAGQFVLSFGKDFQPDPSAVYYLEALKGLDNNRPSSNVARVRTLAKFQAGTWTTLTNGSILISRSTTALSIGAALKQGTATPVDFNALIGKLVPGATSEQDVYTPVANLSGADFTALLTLVTTNLTADRDPVATLGYNAGTSAWVNMSSGGGSGFTVTSATPATGGAGTSVTIAGTGFSTTVASNSVTFAGTTATVTAATATSLTTTVPTGAVSGQVVVTVDGTSALGPLFTVPVTVSGFSPTGGTVGTTVTVTGTGFSTTAADNWVLFNGQRATVTSGTATSLTVTVPATATGKVSVFVKGSSGTSAGDFTYGSPFLAAITPQVAGTGAKLTLDGNFGSTATVNFPGGSSVAATMLGPNRVEVTVPAGATAGNLTVTTGSVTTNARYFRRASFSLGLQAFRTRYEQLDYGRKATRAATGRYGATSEVIGNYVYLFGGYTSANTTTATVERALIGADGSLGSFAIVSGRSINTARYGHVSLVAGRYVYVIGGNGNSSTLSSVERAEINADGSIGPFADVPGVNLVTGRRFPTVAALGGFVYVFGGWNGTTVYNSVERAPLNADGSMGPFETVSGVTLATQRYQHATVVIEGFVYHLGGLSGAAGTTTLASIERAVINGNGTIGSFTTVSGVTMGTPRAIQATVALGGYLYVIGGFNGAAAPSTLATMERSPISAGGGLGAFEPMTLTLNTARYGAATQIIGNHVYLVSGYDGTYLTSVERASIVGSHTVGTFTTIGAMTVGRVAGSPVVIGNYLYLIGGYDGASIKNTVERAVVNADGSIGSFTVVPGVTLVTGRYGFGHACVIDDYVYVLGGIGANGNSYLTSVEAAPIYPDGSIGTFSSAGNLVNGRYNAMSVVLSDRLLSIAGRDVSGDIAYVEAASIGSNGTIGSFATVAGLNVVTRRNAAIVGTIGNNLYLMGGQSQVLPYANPSVESAPLGANDSVGAFATAAGVTLNTGFWNSGAVMIGQNLYTLGGYNADALLQTSVVNSSGVLANFTASALGIATFGQANVVLGNYLYLFSGYENSAYLTSVRRAPLQ